MKNNADNPAFPLPVQAVAGLTKREYMATHLMAGLATWAPFLGATDMQTGSPEWHAATQKARAEYAVAEADALLEALNK